jgi:hypothetical protein
MPEQFDKVSRLSVACLLLVALAQTYSFASNLDSEIRTMTNLHRVSADIAADLEAVYTNL